jgi:predicted acyl esterase
MTTRPDVLGLIGWGISSTGVAARETKPYPSTAVTIDDPLVAIVENAWIPMADGTRLAARLFLPASSISLPTWAVQG